MTGKIDLRYVVALDAAQANAELARLHKEATTAAGTSDRMTAATKATTTALKEEAAAVRTTAQEFPMWTKAANDAADANDKLAKTTTTTTKAKETFQQRIGKLPDLLGKQAAAISLVSSSMEGMGGQVGKLVAGAGQMAAAYGAGGPFALALVGGMALVELLTDHWKKLNEEQDRALNKKFEKTDALTQRIRDLRDEVGKLEDSVDPENTAQGQIAALTEEAIELRRQARENITKSFSPSTDTSLIKGLRTEANFLKQAAELIDRKAAALQKIKDAKGTGPPTPPTAIVAVDEATSEADLAAGRAAIDLTAGRDARRRRQRANAQAAAWADEAAVDESNATSVQEQIATRLRIEKGIDDEVRAYKQREYDAALQAERDFQDAKNQIALSGVGIVASASQTLIGDLISGQELALERFGVSIMASAGQALISFGFQALGKGVQYAADPFSAPFAPANFAAGALLIGTGVGLGGLAAGLGGLMGGGGGRASDARTASLPSSSSRSSSGASAPRNITIVYGGASGPTADHAADAVTSAERRAADRNYDRSNTR